MKKQKKRGTIRSKFKRGDEVVFIAGKEYNRYQNVGGEAKRVPYRGRVIAVDARNYKLKVEGAMIVKKHQKPNPQLNVEGGIIRQEAWFDASNVAHIDPKTNEPTRIGYEIRDGVKVRVAKKSGEVIPEPNRFVQSETETPKEEPAEETSETKVEESEAKEEKAEDKKEDKKEDKE